MGNSLWIICVIKVIKKLKKFNKILGLTPFQENLLTYILVQLC